jgi:hypothetical protein
MSDERSSNRIFEMKGLATECLTKDLLTECLTKDLGTECLMKDLGTDCLTKYLLTEYLTVKTPVFKITYHQLNNGSS